MLGLDSAFAHVPADAVWQIPFWQNFTLLNRIGQGNHCMAPLLRHHGIKGSKRLMDVLRTLDYVAIYFLIPGTMMPAGSQDKLQFAINLNI